MTRNQDYLLLFLADNREWVEILLDRGDGPDGPIRLGGAWADWGITRAAPEPIVRFVADLRPNRRFQYDVAGDPETFDAYDLIVSLHARQIFSADLVRRTPCVNLHPGLPEQRGWAPYCRAIIDGENQAGCTLHRMGSTIDSGHVYDMRRVAVEPDDTAGSLRQRLSAAEHAIFDEWFPGRIAELVQPVNGDAAPAAPLRTRAEFERTCELNRPEELQVIRKLRGLTFAPERGAAYYVEKDVRYHVSLVITRSGG